MVAPARRLAAAAAERHSTAIRLSEVLENSARIEAGAYAIEKRNAEQAVRLGAIPSVPLYGSGGLALEANNAFRFRRVYVAPERGVPFLSSSDIIALRPDPERFLSMRHTPGLEDLRIHQHDVLISCSGTVGNVALAGARMEGMALSQHAIRARFADADIAGYAVGFLRSRYGRPQLTGASYGSVIVHIEPEHLRGVWIPDPGQESRARLGRPFVDAAAFRDRANDLLDEADRYLHEALGLPPLPPAGAPTRTVRAANLAGRFEASYHAALPADAEAAVARLRCPVTTLGDPRVAEVRAVTKFRKRVYVKRGGLPMLNSKQLFQVDPVAVKRLAKGAHTKDLPEIALEEGMVLVTRSGTIGKVQIVPRYMEGWTASEDALRVLALGEVDPGYLYAWLASDHGNVLVARQTYGSIIRHVDLEQLASVPVPLPDSAVIAEISGLVRSANQLRDDAWRAEQGALAKIEALIEAGTN
jgi:type I restriction enzyme S subunit